MITSIQNLNTEFFRQFHKMQIPMTDGSTMELSARYYKKSSYDYSEGDNQSYPCVSIQDFSPTIREGWFVDHRDIYLGLSPDKKIGYLGRNPLWLEAKYDVSVASKGYKEFIDITAFFDKTFYHTPSFILNAKEVDGLIVGDVVSKSVSVTDIPRLDGVFERNYEFTLFPWVYLYDETEVDLIERIIVSSSPAIL